ncbi:thiamine pyrophosphate-dependent enzyme [Amycolatopsis sp. DSM 110486]|uniref:thiamine pyrophosphate-dependent enzyme n=1 Tax=Amycolatopsis sp. DSM 110486 TaxID=2865832 RepID=UPI001C6A7571|nr:thiamine pyrophosphate-dependent enzyme [Amycolatopsis sp. DSM 110486]QYN18473.1 ubiquinone-dependent pyruvate dehydrogenase [Amycolatopsis sp. DSM 110486]
MTTVGKMLVQSLADHGVSAMWGVVGDALNPITDALRQEPRIRWIGVRHEEAGAFAAGAQSQLTGRIGVCMGTVGPGSLHLLNGLYDAKKSHTPLLAICGQVPSAEMGSDYHQEVDNDAVFRDVSVFSRTITDPAQFPYLLELAVNAAYARNGVAVLTLPGDIAGRELPHGTQEPRFVSQHPPVTPEAGALGEVAAVLNGADTVTMLVGSGARPARDEVLATAETLAAPMVLTLKGKETLERDNDYQVGQTGLIGNPAAQHALSHGDVLLMVGTDFPYRDWYPKGKTVVQIDHEGERIGRRVHVDHALVGDARTTLAALLPLLEAKPSRAHLTASRERYTSWRDRQRHLADPGYDSTVTGRVRKQFDNRERAIRPEVLAAAIDRHADADAVFTSDTGMSTVWLARFVTLHGNRQLLGSYNLGSMANALPHALGAAQLDPARQTIAFCGDGGLTMLMGELLTVAAYELPVKIFVFDNSRLGMVKLEQEQGGIPEFGTVLKNPDLAGVARACGIHAVRVEHPDQVDAGVRAALAHPGPVLVDVVTNAEEIVIPPKPTVGQAWGFAIAKIEETLISAHDVDEKA